jgi:hypothetical protein
MNLLTVDDRRVGQRSRPTQTRIGPLARAMKIAE